MCVCVCVCVCLTKLSQSILQLNNDRNGIIMKRIYSKII